ncbi:MFS transporter [Burkholderia multivorans]|uniref:MFS transporter n=1 Tax=Burkholderia ubonensis TaxID=101571 RepID=UPI000F6E2E57|nr:MFS transporter [Burkholderia ubonensis]AYZ68172.1 MFS transporter [Burkholderia multivorans]VWC25085.1 membrane protein [Burkholderia ubonensis]
MNTTTLTTPEAVHPGAAKMRRLILAASIGNALEWFDLIVYGFFAVTIAKLFFPATSEATSLLLTLGTFGLSYLIRPIGGLVLGAYADRAGRKASLLLSIGMMMGGTLLIATMPTYASIGLLAPLGIMLSRLMQGFSAGGEFASSTAFLVEHAPQRRGFMSSWQFASQGLATLLASGFGALLTGTLTPAQLETWGWRVPFLFGLAIGPVGLYIRRYVDEGVEFRAQARSEAPVRELFAGQKTRVLLAIGVLVISTAVNYMVLYMPTYAIKQLGLPASTGFAATLATGFILTLFTPLVGHWSDRVGRIRVMTAAALLMLVTVWPTFAWLTRHASFSTILAALIWIGLLKAMYCGALPALMAELFPAQTRATGLAVSYNTGVTLFGGFAPFVITWLISTTGNRLSPALYLMGCALLSLAALFVARTRLRMR